MEGMNHAAWIKTNIVVVENYLKNAFENFTIAHQLDNLRTHTFTVDN